MWPLEWGNAQCVGRRHDSRHGPHCTVHSVPAPAVATSPQLSGYRFTSDGRQESQKRQVLLQVFGRT